MNKTRDDMVYDFMVALAANSSINPPTMGGYTGAIRELAEALADEYLSRGA